FYPGCSLETSGKEYSQSLHAVAQKCGIELETVKDWCCCGATAAHSLNHDLAIALPGRTIALAEKQGFTELLVPCAACFSRLASAQLEIKGSEHVRKQMEDYLEMPVTGNIRLLTILEFLEEHIFPVAEQYIVNKLDQKVACYYGCLLARPKESTRLQRPEDPMEMETVMKKAGASPIDWAFKTECCGAGLSVSRTDIVAKLSGKILEDAVDRGAESIVVACPMCQMNLDLRRKEINKQLNRKIDVPVLFVTQVLGLSMGIPADQLGLNKHFVPTGNTVSCVARLEK
ncbi:MAG: CoB--CoM heterodisulfide reductase iron-sulfur subunit B family protein, partial [Bacteroidota bacterium]|nr:CoB--CoM heterodisulfide reductase iron-sulfur subunit B family protein [Bacteroidota bacterium]